MTRSLISILKKNCNAVFLVMVILGLPISILIKEYNAIFFAYFDAQSISIFRVLLILMIFFIFIFNKYRINKKILLLLFLNVLYFYNQNYGSIIEFSQNSFDYSRSLNYSKDSTKNISSLFFLEKNKNLIINFFNIILPLLVLSLVDFKVEKQKVEKFLLQTLSFSFYILIAIIFISTITNLNSIKYNTFFLDTSFFLRINPHLTLLIFSYSIMFFFSNWVSENRNKKHLLKIALVCIVLFLIGGNLHFFLSLFVIILFIFLNNSFKKKYKIILLIFFIILIIFSLLNINNHNWESPGTIAHSIYYRLKIIYFYLNFSINLNYIFGNNIFVSNIFTYPHNFIVDIFICTGAVGLIALLYVQYQIFFKGMNVFKIEILNLIFVYTLIFSLFSGFYFNNITLNVLLAIFLILSKEKAKNNK